MMPRPRGTSVSQSQEKEIPNVDAYLTVINDIFKSSAKQVDRLSKTLEIRYATEDAYITSLSKIQPLLATMSGNESRQDILGPMIEYESSLDNTIKLHSEFRKSIRDKLEFLNLLKDEYESKRKEKKKVMGDVNKAYIKYRTVTMPKLNDDYLNKCGELQSTQQQYQQQQQQQLQLQQMQQQQMQQQQLQQDQLSEENAMYKQDATREMVHEEEPRPRTSTEMQLLGQSGSYDDHKKTMAGFMAHVRSQFSNMAVSTTNMHSDAAKHIGKLKKSVEESDHRYREGIVELERHRKDQRITTQAALKELDSTLKNKGKNIKKLLIDILQDECTMLSENIKLVTGCQVKANNFRTEFEAQAVANRCIQLRDTFPQPVMYENFYYPGKCRYLLFGTSLKDYQADHSPLVIPILVQRCIEAVEHHGGFQKEGIYRVSPSLSKVEMLKNAFEQDEMAPSFKQYDVTTFAAVLKSFLRDLKEPLFHLTQEQRQVYYDTTDNRLRLQLLQSYIQNLPDCHRETLKMIICHLKRVSNYSKVNKMGLQNLRVVFAPNIFQTFKSSDVAAETSILPVFEDLFVHWEYLFSMPPMTPHPVAAPISPIGGIAPRPLPPHIPTHNMGYRSPASSSQDMFAVTSLPQSLTDPAGSAGSSTSSLPISDQLASSMNMAGPTLMGRGSMTPSGDLTPTLLQSEVSPQFGQVYPHIPAHNDSVTASQQQPLPPPPHQQPQQQSQSSQQQQQPPAQQQQGKPNPAVRAPPRMDSLTRRPSRPRDSPPNDAGAAVDMSTEEITPPQTKPAALTLTQPFNHPTLNVAPENPPVDTMVSEKQLVDE